MILKYKADVSLLTTWIDSKRIEPYPLVAVFEFDNKRLIYVGTEHNSFQHLAPKSFDAINYAFSKFDIDCVVTEFEHTYKNIEDRFDVAIGETGMNELAYAPYIAKKKCIPYIFADTNLADWIKDLDKLSHDKTIILQTMWILNSAAKYKKHFKKNDTIKHAFDNVKTDLSEMGFDMPLTMEELKKCVKNDFGFDVSDENISDILNTIPNWNKPDINGHITNQIWAEIGLYSRNPYMLKSIFKAINKYDNVLVTMGAGHYEAQRLALEKAFGNPKYIHKFPTSKRVDMEQTIQPLSHFPQNIKTSRLVLNIILPTKDNAETILDIIEQNRDYLEAWQGHFGELKTVDDVEAYLTKRTKQIKTNQGVCFYIFHNDNIIGRIRFFGIDNKTCEIGYWLIKSENGHGYMSEALSALETELFKFGFNKITLDIDNGNTPSENLAKRNGYKLVKRLPMASYAKCVGKCDSLIYVKNKSETR